jgi:hypothetical protein
MSDPIAPTGEASVRAAIQRASRATGVDFSLLVETARRESAMNPHAKASTSSATGLFQFIDSTWLDMVRRHGADHGLGRYASALQSGLADPGLRREILALRTDPEMAARMAGELARENADALQARLGRAASAGELYAAHVMGQGGAARLIEAAARGENNAAAIFPREAAANRGLFYTSNGAPRSAQGLLDRLDLDANAALNARAPAEVRKSGDESMSPALAQALFAMALLPLLRTGVAEEDRYDPLQALAAYRRASE